MMSICLPTLFLEFRESCSSRLGLVFRVFVGLFLVVLLVQAVVGFPTDLVLSMSAAVIGIRFFVVLFISAARGDARKCRSKRDSMCNLGTNFLRGLAEVRCPNCPILENCSGCINSSSPVDSVLIWYRCETSLLLSSNCSSSDVLIFGGWCFW